MSEKKRQGLKEVFRNIGCVISGYIVGLILLSLIEGSLLALGLYFIGIPYGIIIGYFAGLLNFIPSLGVLIGIIPAIISALFATHPVRSLILVGVLYTFVQILDGLVLGPKILGRKVGLHPVFIILAIVVGTHFFGLLGFFVSVPLVAIAILVYRYLRKMQYGSTEENSPEDV